MGSKALRVAGKKKKKRHYHSESFPFAELESITVNVSAIKMPIFYNFKKSVHRELCQNHDVHQLEDIEFFLNHNLFVFYAEIKHYFEVVF